MAPYTPTQYLLDHTFITQTLHKLYTLLDTAQFPRLASSEVFTSPTFQLDYTAMFPSSTNQPTVTSPQAIVENAWRPLISKMVSTQHVMSAVVVYGLPVPGTEVPDDGDKGGEVREATATAYVIAHLCKRAEDGKGVVMTSNGGIGEYKLVRMEEGECRARWAGKGSWDGNCWRVSEVKVVPKWYEGDVEGILGQVVPL
ncbi:uncharacterized protein AB675_10420 [Cyphellophora attinorum]|uniref:SnoaL-like domain-containing protein n=1 Tax=Cyphellophora attinorum TaxID=1664694 RepID=A0A0N0NIP7_9EURO|nr:uncharacterized protein AB675_10420 [Phialophora attinorum]KPI35988.1 hypothetical protein AB675_10420 [Phialophora attinorum]